MENHYSKLTKLIMTIKSLYPDTTTIHSPTESIEKDYIHPADLQMLYEMLVHTITIINRLYRQKDKDGNYISEREDYAGALMLISPMFAVNTLNVPPSVRKDYQSLVTTIGLENTFTWRDLHKITGKSKTRCNGILHELMGLKLIKKVGTGYQQMYEYELIPVKNENPGAFEEIISEWDDFKQWVEF